MKTATIRDLRYDFPKVEAWLLNGDEVELTRQGRPIAKITPLMSNAAAAYPLNSMSGTRKKS